MSLHSLKTLETLVNTPVSNEINENNEFIHTKTDG